MRRNSRELALQTLFQSEFAPAVSARELTDVSDMPLSQEDVEHAQMLVKGVQDKKSEIDARISSVSQHWKLDRMASVDRNILRLAIYEMQFSPDPLKPAIVINEAVEMAKKFGTTESAGFVNGLLDQIGKRL